MRETGALSPRKPALKTRIFLTLPRSLKKAAPEFAAKDGVSVNQYIALTLAEKIGARGEEAFFAGLGKNGNTARAIALLEGRPE